MMESLVSGGIRQYGRLGSRPRLVNPLDEFTGVSRSLRSLRLKEWVGFTLVHPDWFSSLIIQDAHYLSSSEVYAYDRARGALHQHSNARGGSLGMPAGLDGERIAYERPGYAISYDFAAGGPYALRFDIAATASAPAFTGSLELHPAGASAPLSVSSRLPGGKLYTNKALYPVSGALSVGDQKAVFDASRDIAILDEHKSLFPYRTTWLWGTMATRAADGAPLGANFCARPGAAGQEEESCVWTPSGCEPLSDVTFTPAPAAGPLAPWHVASADGRLDVTFTPEGRKAVKHQLVLVGIDYFQLFGHYRGVLRSADGQAYQLDGVHGVCESFKARLLARSAGGVEPADGRAVAGPAERLKLVVPGGAQQLVQFLLQRRHARGAEGHHGAEPALGDQDVAVGAGDRAERAEVGRIAVADGVAARRRLLGHLEAQPVPAGQGRGDRASRPRLPMPGQLSAKRPRGSGLADPGHADRNPDRPCHRPLNVRAQRGRRRVDLQNTINRHRAS